MFFNTKVSSFKKLILTASLSMTFAFSNTSHAAEPLKVAYKIGRAHV